MLTIGTASNVPTMPSSLAADDHRCQRDDRMQVDCLLVDERGDEHAVELLGDEDDRGHRHGAAGADRGERDEDYHGPRDPGAEDRDEEASRSQQRERPEVGRADYQHPEGDHRAVDQRDERDAADVAGRAAPRGLAGGVHPVAALVLNRLRIQSQIESAGAEDVEEEDEHEQRAADELRGERVRPPITPPCTYRRRRPWRPGGGS